MQCAVLKATTSATELDGDRAGSNAGGVEAPSAVGAQLPPHLQDRHDYLTSGADMNFNVRCAQPTCSRADLADITNMSRGISVSVSACFCCSGPTDNMSFY